MPYQCCPVALANDGITIISHRPGGARCGLNPEPLRALIGAFEVKSCVLREPELKGGGGAGRASEAMRSPWSRARRTPSQLLLRYHWHYGKFVSDVHDKLIGRIFRMKV